MTPAYRNDKGPTYTDIRRWLAADDVGWELKNTPVFTVALPADQNSPRSVPSGPNSVKNQPWAPVPRRRSFVFFSSYLGLAKRALPQMILYKSWTVESLEGWQQQPILAVLQLTWVNGKPARTSKRLIHCEQKMMIIP